MSTGRAISKRIIDYINEYQMDKNVRDFLIWALNFELERVGDGNPQFKKEYQRNIQKYLSSK